MALTKYQHSNKFESGNLYPHSQEFPGLFSAYGSNSATKFDFRYIYRIYNQSGLMYETYITPGDNGIGWFDASKIVKTLFERNFAIVNAVTPTNNIHEYIVTVAEFYDSAEQGSESTFSKSMVSNLSYNEVDSRFPFEINNQQWGKFLTNMEPNKRYMQTNLTEASWFFMNDSSFEDIDKIKYLIKFKHPILGTVNQWVYTLDPLAFYTFSAASGTVESATNAVGKIPIGYATLADTSTLIDRLGFFDSANVWHPSAASGQPGVAHGLTGFIPIELIVRTEEAGSPVSQDYIWEIPECNTSDKNQLTIMWENIYGGLDFFNFNKIRTDSIGNKPKRYVHNSYKASTTNRYRYNEIDKANESTYTADKNYGLILRTGFLQAHEINMLKGLWNSNYIVLHDGTDFIPVNLEDTSKVINYDKQKQELVMYKIKLSYSKIIK